MKTQNARLLQYLKTHRKGITQLEAFNALGVCRLSERIWELEHSSRDYRFGVSARQKITRTRERVKTRYGYATVVRYRLV